MNHHDNAITDDGIYFRLFVRHTFRYNIDKMIYDNKTPTTANKQNPMARCARYARERDRKKHEATRTFDVMNILLVNLWFMIM